jgi:hypothetical protein
MRFLETLYHRFVFKTEDEKFNVFLWFFVIQNLAIGILFILAPFLPSISALILFSQIDKLVPIGIAAGAWGGFLVTAFFGHLAEMYWRARGIGPWVAMATFIMWFFAMVSYVMAGQIMGVIGICIPQLFFWGWYYISARKYKWEVDNHLVELVH